MSKVSWDAVKASAQGTAPEKNAELVKVQTLDDLGSIPITILKKALAYYAYNTEYRSARNGVLKDDRVKALLSQLRKEKGIGLSSRRSKS